MRLIRNYIEKFQINHFIRDSAYVITSDRLEHRFATNQVPFEPYQRDLHHEHQTKYEYGAENRLEFELRRDKSFQTVLGFGGAFTDAAGWNIAKLEPEAQV